MSRDIRSQPAERACSHFPHMDLKHHPELKALMDTFVVLGNQSVLSSDSEAETSLEYEYSPDKETSVHFKAVATDKMHRLDFEGLTEEGNQDFYNDFCARYINFTNTCPTTYHVVSHFKTILKEKGFVELSERSSFGDLEAGKYYVCRDGQSMAVFTVGAGWKPEYGAGVVGSHIDAITNKLKPTSKKSNVDSYNLLGVALYSRGTTGTWVDRDLGIAGRLIIRGLNGKILSRLVNLGAHAVARIPSLAPHFGGISIVEYNPETQMVPVIGLSGPVQKAATDEEKSSPLYNHHSLALLRYLARISNVKVSQMISCDLELFDVQPATRGGLELEFLFAPRVDDRLCLYAAFHGLLEYASKVDFLDNDELNVVLLANNEEIGSGTRTGAKGKLLNAVVDRIIAARKPNSTPADSKVAYANSIVLSADVTHALNPNFTQEYLADHYPLPNVGLCVKKDPNGNVVTDSVGIALMEEIARNNNLQLQQFHIRNGARSGSTIGPILAQDTGALTIDVGLPQLSMHSIRATAGFKEPGIGVETFRAFFQDWRTAFRSLRLD